MTYSKNDYNEISSLLRAELSDFLIVAEKENISRAAESLGKTQSQVSKSLAHLEYIVGEKLFTRRSRGVQLTRPGSTLLEKIKRMSALLKQLTSESGPLRLLRVGFHPSIGMTVFPEVLHPFSVQHAPLELQVWMGPSLEVTQKVSAGELDFGFVINHQKNSDMVARKITTDSVSIWNRDRSPAGGLLYFHPDMYRMEKFSKKLSEYVLVPLADYEMIAESIKKNSGVRGLLPRSIALRHGLEPAQPGSLFSVELALIARKDLLNDPQFRNHFQKIYKMAIELKT